MNSCYQAVWQGNWPKSHLAEVGVRFFLINCDDIFSIRQINIFLSLQEWVNAVEHSPGFGTRTFRLPHDWTHWKIQVLQRWVWAMMDIGEVPLHSTLTFSNTNILTPEKYVFLLNYLVILQTKKQKWIPVYQVVCDTNCIESISF